MKNMKLLWQVSFPVSLVYQTVQGNTTYLSILTENFIIAIFDIIT